jgi:hypothetical protein
MKQMNKEWLIVTQNVDNLHQASGCSPDTIAEVLLLFYFNYNFKRFMVQFLSIVAENIVILLKFPSIPHILI